MKPRMLALAATMFLMAGSLFAHHPFSAEYDWKKPVTVSGTVTKVEWSNPHARVFMDVKDIAGNPQKWEFELGSINALSKLGWVKNTLKNGDVVTVDAWMARSKDNAANVKSIRFSDGRELSGASSIAEGSVSGSMKATPSMGNYQR